MAEGWINQDFVEQITTGVSGITAYKVGNIKFLQFYNIQITAASSGWVVLGTLPQALFPQASLRFMLYDSQSSSYATSNIYQAYITTGGEVNIWAFSDKLSMRVTGYICYV